MNAREEVIDWLRDAYAMERALEKSLERQSTDEDLSAPLRQQAAVHLEETRRHAEQVRGALQSLGADTSALKTGLGVIGERMKSIGTAFTRDEAIKEVLTAYSMEQFEIACYTALAAGADELGLVQVADTCRRIITDEEQMAQTLLRFLPDMVRTYLSEARAKAA